MGGKQKRAHPPVQVSAAPGHVELSCPSVIRIDLSVNQALLLKKIYHLAEIDRVDTHSDC
ncbi:MAG: hypothetical protein NVS2B1_13990 [Bradyrhizobium sp.]